MEKDTLLVEMLTAINEKLDHALKLNPSIGVSLVREAQFGLEITLKLLRESKE